MSWINDCIVGAGFWQVPENQWTKIYLDLSNAEKAKDSNGWNVLKCRMSIEKGDDIPAELEFWSLTPLAMFLKANGMENDQDVYFECQRTKAGGRNQVRFRLDPNV